MFGRREDPSYPLPGRDHGPGEVVKLQVSLIHQLSRATDGAFYLRSWNFRLQVCSVRIQSYNASLMVYWFTREELGPCLFDNCHFMNAKIGRRFAETINNCVREIDLYTPTFLLTKCHRNGTLYIKRVLTSRFNERLNSFVLRTKDPPACGTDVLSDPGGPVVTGLCVSPQSHAFRDFHATSEENGSWPNCSGIAHKTLLCRDGRADSRGPRVPYSLSRPALQGYFLSCTHGY